MCVLFWAKFKQVPKRRTKSLKESLCVYVCVQQATWMGELYDAVHDYKEGWLELA